MKIIQKRQLHCTATGAIGTPGDIFTGQAKCPNCASLLQAENGDMFSCIEPLIMETRRVIFLISCPVCQYQFGVGKEEGDLQ